MCSTICFRKNMSYVMKLFRPLHLEWVVLSTAICLPFVQLSQENFTLWLSCFNSWNLCFLAFQTLLTCWGDRIWMMPQTTRNAASDALQYAIVTLRADVHCTHIRIIFGFCAGRNHFIFRCCKRIASTGFVFPIRSLHSDIFRPVL